jgi:hypothetical protein
LWVFVALAAAWIVIAAAPDWQAASAPTAARTAARLAGYVALIAMLVPYLHILRRAFRYRQGRTMTFWLRLHIACAYVAFAMVLVHSQGRAHTPLTWALVALTWTVMISGVIGYYGQKLLYFLMPRMVAEELGLERLAPQWLHLKQQAEELAKKKEMQGAAEVIQRFCATTQERLSLPLSLRGWLRRRRTAEELLSENWHQRALSFADEKQRPVLLALWELLLARRRLDIEYRLHQLGRLWLVVHGPAAWALLVLMLEHVIMSWRYGGF